MDFQTLGFHHPSAFLLNIKALFFNGAFYRAAKL